ncbi:hypothetical protein LguiA_001072 [Lonicera macranthoides]
MSKEKFSQLNLWLIYAIIVKSAEQILHITTPPATRWKLLWRFHIAPKICNFLWRALNYCLPTITALRSCKIDIVNSCTLCQISEKDDYHALGACPFARRVWTVSKYRDAFGVAPRLWLNGGIICVDCAKKLN